MRIERTAIHTRICPGALSRNEDPPFLRYLLFVPFPGVGGVVSLVDLLPLSMERR
jgi:hypothetical protein